MKKFKNLNTYYKLLLLIIGTSVFFLLLYLSLYAYTIQQENEVFESTKKQFNSEVNSLFKLNSKTHLATITDVTYWDDLVRFTKSKDKKWYDSYILQEFESYEVDFIGVYDLNNQLIMNTNSSNLKTVNFISNDILSQLYKSRLTKFYLKIPEGVIEVFGATIHPSNDPKKNKTNPSGYFIMARLLNSKFIQNLERISNSKIEFANTNSSIENDNEFLIAPLNLTNWKNQTISKILFKREFKLDFKSTKKILCIIILAFILNSLLYLFYSKKWIYSPIKNITSILESENIDALNNLKKSQGEFGYIGNLFEENNNQRKQLEISKRKSEESDQLKSAFLANLSHEIRTPMNAIIGFSDLLDNKNLKEEEKAEYLSIIKNSGKNLVSIIEDLLEMSKIDANQISPKLKSFDLNACMHDIYETVRITIPKDKQIKFSIKESKHILSTYIFSDEIKLKQVIVNLINNAIKYTTHGNVVFGYEINETEGVVEFKVEDTGVGIDEKHLKIIFDRFRRIEDDFSAELSGLGLGLAICKAYVDMLGGKIMVSSKIGKGSVFNFTIPLKYNQSEKETKEIFTNNNTDLDSNIVILVAEDDNINFMLIKKMLELKNHTIIRAVNGKEAVFLCTTNPSIKLVFMDIKMPIMDGYAAFKEIKVLFPNLPVIAQTAHSSVEDKERVMQAGFTDYVTKPLNREKLFELIYKYFNDK